MLKNTNIIAALGVAAGLGMAAMPAAGVFADGEQKSTEVVLGVTVDGSIAINVSPNDVTSVIMMPDDINTSMASHITVKTSAVKGYTLKIRDKDDNLNLVNETDNTKIIAPSDSALEAGVSGWNYTVTTNGGSKLANRKISASDIEIDSTDKAGSGTTVVTYNVATSSDQTSGTYTDTVIYTAVANPTV